MEQHRRWILHGRCLLPATIMCGLFAPLCAANPIGHSVDAKISTGSAFTQCSGKESSTALIAEAAIPAATESTPTPNRETNRETAKDMVETITRVDRAANEVIAEVSRRKQETVCYQHAYYDMYGSSYRYLGDPETEDVGPLLPPRKKWLDYGVDQLQRLSAILNSDVSSFQLPSDQKAAKKEELGVQLQIAHDCMSSIMTKVQMLKSLSVGPEYDNKKIADAAKQIPDQLDGLNTVRKRLVHLY